MKNKQKVKEYIQKEIPEIMELRFGCEVSFRNSTFNICKITSSNGYGKYKSTNYNGWWNNKDKELGLVILGRPITLSDVLRVIGYKNIPFTVNCLGYIYNHKIEENATWDLEENYNNQSDEVYDLLTKILEL